MNEKGANSIMSKQGETGCGCRGGGWTQGAGCRAAAHGCGDERGESLVVQGVCFAGVSLEGSTLRSDGGANKNLYGKELERQGDCA